ncbi:MAG: hypothetical protein ABIQ27_06205 [Flavobacterium sp.]
MKNKTGLLLALAAAILSMASDFKHKEIKPKTSDFITTISHIK